MKKYTFAFLLLVILVACTSEDDTATSDDEPTHISQPDLVQGMDLSFLPELEELGVVFKDQSGAAISDNYSFLKENGVNTVRIRLWINHEDNRYNLASFKEQALKAHAAGMNIFLDFHYSDTWADPGAQRVPQVWSQMNAQELATAASNYTGNILRDLRSSGIIPTIIQIGNETNNGFLWPVAKVYENNTENWESYCLITKQISQTIRTLAPDSQIMVHHAGVEGSVYFYEQLIERNVDFDIAGISYYPWWHGNDIDRFESQLNILAQSVEQNILIAETAYPFSLGRNDDLNNVVWNNNQAVPGYPPTQSGQRGFLLKLEEILRDLPGEKGIGYCYWAPDWVAHDNASQAFINGSNWENVALFDFGHQVTRGFEAYSN